MTYSYERFLKGMELRTSDQVTLNDIGYETIELYKEEMDDSYQIQKQFFQNTFLYHTTIRS